MKKIFKILSIISILIVLGICLFIGGLYLSEHLHNKKLAKERINGSTTLSNYIKYHDVEHTKDINSPFSFYAKDIKCDLLKDKNILYYFPQNMNTSDGILIFDDYSLYKTAFKSDKTYSNGQQCKQISPDIKFKRFQIQNGGLYLIGENNKYYTLDTEQEDVRELDTFRISDENVYRFIENEHIKKIQYLNFISDNNRKDVYAVLKDDGQIYEQYYQYKVDSGKYVMIDEKVFFSNNDYGHISDFIYNYMGEGNIHNGIKGIVSDKGLFYLKQTDDQKYIDTEQTFEMISSDIYSKYKADIKYINGNYVFTTDNNIIATNMLCEDIDKEVK